MRLRIDSSVGIAVSQQGGALGKALKKREPPKPRGPDPMLMEIFTDPVVIGALKKRIGE